MSVRAQVLALLGTWARPADVPAKLALGFGVAFALAAVFGRGRSFLFDAEHEDPEDVRRERRRFLALVSLAAGLLSIGYISSYLRGGPRIIDATTYFLQGRALSHGHLSWTPLDPTASFRGRFLLFREGAPGADASLGGIFPPGYPLLLSFGFMLGAPMIVGPLLAMGLVAATYALTRTLAEDVTPKLAEGTARAAALLSLICAALRYHTADTMSHGATALFITIALTSALRARRARLADIALPEDDRSPFDGGRLEAAIAGLTTGFVVATRPISAIPIAIVVGWILFRTKVDERRSRLVLLAILGVVPGLFLLLLSQRVLTGSWLTSTQRLYYALSDGPLGCFRLGFGKGIGCLFEHGEFVDARLRDGYGLTAAAGTTLRRLHKHVLDVANFEPLALLVLLPLLLRRGASAIVPATALVFMQMLAYVPFYFDGDYPGGGARFFADVLPVEHALVMVGIALLVSRSAPADERRFVRGAALVLALASFGFAVHGSHEHAALREREGGRPMFEPDVLANAGIKSGLVFVDTDHGFNLGHDPSARTVDGFVIARLRSDERDRMLYEALGKPPTYLYKFDPSPPSTDAAPTPKGTVPTLSPWSPPESMGTRRYEAEAEWPPLAQSNAFAVPVWASTCSSGKRALVVTPEAGKQGSATIAVPVPAAGRYAVEIRTDDKARVPHGPPASGAADATVSLEDARWTWKAHDTCITLPSKEVELRPPYARMTIETSGPVGIDYVSLRKVH